VKPQCPLCLRGEAVGVEISRKIAIAGGECYYDNTI